MPLLGLGRRRSQRTQRAFGTAMRLCASLSRGVAAPLGCVIFSVSVEIAACMPCAQGLSVCARRGVVSLPSERSTRFGNPAWPGFKTANFAAFGSWPGVLPKNAESLRDSDAHDARRCPEASRPRWAAQPLLWSSWLSCFCLKPLLQTALRHGTMVSPNRNP